jgi:hypothetical protein
MTVHHAISTASTLPSGVRVVCVCCSAGNLLTESSEAIEHRKSLGLSGPFWHEFSDGKRRRLDTASGTQHTGGMWVIACLCVPMRVGGASVHPSIHPSFLPFVMMMMSVYETACGSPCVSPL